jgi:cytokinesis protein
MVQDDMSSSITGMPSIRPKKKLKALHWDKVDTPQVTVWAAHAPTQQEKEQKYTDLAKKGVLDEVERLFMAKETKIFGASTAAKQRKDKKQIISNDLSKNFQIALSKFSQFPADDVTRMIIHCDTEILDNMVVMDFLQRDEMCSIPENVAKLMAPYSRDWTVPGAASSEREQDPTELTREDQIYLATAFELNHYWKARMRALALTRSFEHEYEYISTRLQEVVRVSESLRDSVSLMNVLGLILDIGNFMNDSNKQAQGFKLSSLARLGMVKDDKNETTFADLVERIVRNQYPEWEGFSEEIGGVVGLQKVSVDQLRTDSIKYISNIKNVQASLDAGNLSDPKKFHPQDRVSQIVQRSMKDARRKAEQLQLYLDEMVKSYDDIMVFYGEDNADENARRDFFAKLASFLMEWKVSRNDENVLMMYRLLIRLICRNLARRISAWKSPGSARRLLWLASGSMSTLPMVPPPKHLIRLPPAEPWTRCLRSCVPLRLRPRTCEIVAVVLVSRSVIKCALLPGKSRPISREPREAKGQTKLLMAMPKRTRMAF